MDAETKQAFSEICTILETMTRSVSHISGTLDFLEFQTVADSRLRAFRAEHGLPERTVPERGACVDRYWWQDDKYFKGGIANG